MRRTVAAVTLLLAACDSTGAYVYFARSYDVDRDCLGKTEGLDVMAGTDPGLGCAPRKHQERDAKFHSGFTTFTKRSAS